MIRSFRDRRTDDLFHRRRVKGVPTTIQCIALRMLLMVHAAEALDDLRVPPGNRLEKLKGGRKGQHSIRVNDPWRICFVWSAGDATQVELIDYH